MGHLMMGDPIMRVSRRPIVLNSRVGVNWSGKRVGALCPMRVALRSRIVLLAAEGKQQQISEELKISPRMAALWRGRFLLRGGRGSVERYSPAQAYAVDSSSDGQHRDQQDHADHSSQRDPLVHAHHGA
jgi:hypothetical protein